MKVLDIHALILGKAQTAFRRFSDSCIASLGPLSRCGNWAKMRNSDRHVAS